MDSSAVIEKIKSQLDKAVLLKNGAEKRIRVAALIAASLRTIGRDPVLVGGSAVEFYTQGGHSTEDIDFIADGGKDLIALMETLGFKKVGKDFIDEKRKLYVEFPSANLGASEAFSTISVENYPLKIVSIEDLIIDRLSAFKFWKSEIDGVNVLLLMEIQDYDASRLARRAAEEDVADILLKLEKLKEEAIRKKSTRTETTTRLRNLLR